MSSSLHLELLSFSQESSLDIIYTSPPISHSQSENNKNQIPLVVEKEIDMQQTQKLSRLQNQIQQIKKQLFKSREFNQPLIIKQQEPQKRKKIESKQQKRTLIKESSILQSNVVSSIIEEKISPTENKIDIKEHSHTDDTHLISSYMLRTRPLRDSNTDRLNKCDLIQKKFMKDEIQTNDEESIDFSTKNSNMEFISRNLVKNQKTLDGFQQLAAQYKKNRGISSSQPNEHPSITDKSISSNSNKGDKLNDLQMTCKKDEKYISNQTKTKELKKQQQCMLRSKIVSSSDVEVPVEIELEVPNVDTQVIQKQETLVNNTLFFNKFMQKHSSTATSLLTLPLKEISTNLHSNLISNILTVNHQNTLAPKNKSNEQKVLATTRKEYLNQRQRHIAERRSQCLNLLEMHDRFKQTSLEYVGLIAAVNSENQISEDKLEYKQIGDIISDNQSESDNDQMTQVVKRKPFKQIATHISEGEIGEIVTEGEDRQIKSSCDFEKFNEFHKKQNNKLLNKLQNKNISEERYRKLLAFEESSLEQSSIQNPFKVIRENNIPEKKSSQKKQEINQESINILENQNKLDNNKSFEDVELDLQFEDITSDNNIENSQLKPIKLLKRSRKETQINKELLEQKEKQRAERKEQREQFLSNPLMKRFLDDMIDVEAELGSDSEDEFGNKRTYQNPLISQGKNVKEITEHEEAGLDCEEALNKDLSELIDDSQIENEINDQDLIREKYLLDQVKHDKHELECIVQGEFRKNEKLPIGNKRRRSQISYNNSDNCVSDSDSSQSLSENRGIAHDGILGTKKFKRVEDALRLIRETTEEGGDYGNGIEDGGIRTGHDIFNDCSKEEKKERRRQRMSEENEFIQFRMARILMRREGQKVSGLFDEKKLIDASLIPLLQQGQIVCQQLEQEYSDSKVTSESNQSLNQKQPFTLFKQFNNSQKSSLSFSKKPVRSSLNKLFQSTSVLAPSTNPANMFLDFSLNKKGRCVINK